MEEIIARKLRIVAARITDAIVDGVVPVQIVIGVHAVPAAVVRLQRIMRPANTSVRAGNNNVLASIAKRPYLGGVGITDSRFDCGRHFRSIRHLDGPWLREVVMNNRVAVQARYVRPGRQCLSDLAITTLHQNCVNDVERLILNVVLVQVLQNWALRALALAQ